MRIKRYDRSHFVELSDGKATYVVLHANHPRELTERGRAAEWR
jgi:L-lysine 2,3-aminomutase